jgi:hypothetical protein
VIISLSDLVLRAHTLAGYTEERDFRLIGLERALKEGRQALATLARKHHSEQEEPEGLSKFYTVELGRLEAEQKEAITARLQNIKGRDTPLSELTYSEIKDLRFDLNHAFTCEWEVNAERRALLTEDELDTALAQLLNEGVPTDLIGPLEELREALLEMRGIREKRILDLRGV